MSEAVARLVERGDPDRWRTAMTASEAARPGLLALYAFNLELARAPWVASEPLLAAIRLQYTHAQRTEHDAEGNLLARREGLNAAQPRVGRL